MTDYTIFEDCSPIGFDETHPDTVSCGGAQVRRLIYEETPEGKVIHAARKEFHMPLRKAAGILGISAMDLTGVEAGRLKFKSTLGFSWAYLRIVDRMSQARHVSERSWKQRERLLSPHTHHPCTHWIAGLCDCKGSCSCHWENP